MTYDATTERWQDVTDADVGWMLAHGFNAAELAYTAGISDDAAEWWMRSVIAGREVVA